MKLNFLLLFTVVFSVYALSIPAGNVSGTWTKANSPYQIQGNITVPNGETLTIEPGVSVEFQGYYSLNIQGRIIAKGAANDSIRFTVSDTTGYSDFTATSGAWAGIGFENTPLTNDSSFFDYCVFDHGKAKGDQNGLGVFGGALQIISFNKIAIDHSHFYSNMADDGGSAIDIRTGMCRISNTVFSNNHILNGDGVIATDNFGNLSTPSNKDTLWIDRCSFINNTSDSGTTVFLFSYTEAVHVSNVLIANNESFTDDRWSGYTTISSNECDLSLRNCTVVHNKVADTSNSASTLSARQGKLTISNCIFFNNESKEPDFTLSDMTYAEIQNSIIENELTDFKLSGAQINNSSAITGTTPQWVSASTIVGKDASALTADWHLAAGSPGIDGGTVWSRLDSDGTAADIGAFSTNDYAATGDYSFTGIAGEMDGIISADVTITGDLIVPVGKTLTVSPGVTLTAVPNSSIKVFGKLLAQGTAADSIKFTSFENASWGGIDFEENSTDTSILSHVIVERSTSSGVYSYRSTQIIQNSTIRNNFNGTYIYVNPNSFVAYDNCGGGFSGKMSGAQIKSCTFENNVAQTGGGIFYGFENPDQSALVSECLIKGNGAQRGGGINIYSNNSAHFEKNVIVNNSSAGYPLGQYDSPYGGGLYIGQASPTVSNNIIANNSMKFGGGFYIVQGNPKIKHTTIVNNSASNLGGGLQLLNANPQIMNSIIYGNSAASGPQVYVKKSTPTILYSLLAGGVAGIQLDSASTDNVTNIIDVDPLFISPTAGNTNEHKGDTADWHLKAESPAVDQAPEWSRLDVDGTKADYGAYTVNSWSGVGILGADYIGGEWKDTIATSKTVVEDLIVPLGDTLVINPGVTLSFVPGTALKVYGSIQAVGTATDSITFTGIETHHWNGIELYGDFNFFDKQRGDSPAANFVYCTVNSSIKSGMYLEYRSTVTIDHCSFIDNSTEGYEKYLYYSEGPAGGGLKSNGGLAKITNTLFKGNSAQYGGGIWCFFRSDITVEDCQIFDNKATYSGGGFVADNRSFVKVRRTHISNNSADSSGGGVYIYAHCEPVFENTTITNNTAFKGGGIVADSSCAVLFNNGTIANNKANGNSSQGSGGGVHVLDERTCISLKNSIVYGNTSNANGNNIFLWKGHMLSLHNCLVEDKTNSISHTGDGSSYFSEGVILGEPYWVSPSTGAGTEFDGKVGNWYLTDSSEAIDQGAEWARLDSDGTRSDIGSFTQTDYAGTGELPQNSLSGEISGVITEDALIIGTAEVPLGDTLIIEKGVTLEGKMNASFVVYGTLLTRGTPDSLVTFKSAAGERWNGLCFFWDGSSQSRLFQTVITESYSAGIHCEGSDPLFENCMIANNRNLLGGGVTCVASSPTIKGCLLVNNSATLGAAIYQRLHCDVKIINSTIAHNEASSAGGAIYLSSTADNFSSVAMTNSILWGNRSDAPSEQIKGSSYDKVSCTNSLVYYGTEAIQGVDDVTFTNCVEWTGKTKYPFRFVAPSTGYGAGYDGLSADWHVVDTANTINMGTADTTGLGLAEYDYAGNSRIGSGRIDVGAYEHGTNKVGALKHEIEEVEGLYVYPNIVEREDSELPGFYYSGDKHIRSIEVAIFDKVGNGLFTAEAAAVKDLFMQWDKRNKNDMLVKSGTYVAIIRIQEKGNKVTYAKKIIAIRE